MGENGGYDVALPSKDREILLEALDRGYFATPQEITPTELAAELGLPDRELKQRLARGMATIVTECGEIPDGRRPFELIGGPL